MNDAALSPLACASAPDLARRVGAIVARLIALVASRFLREPRLAVLIVPLYTRLNRFRHRFERLAARLAAGRVARHHPSGPGGRPPTPSLPRGRFWLICALGSEGACCGTQLEALLAEPAVVELLAACPAIGRMLRPFCRMLGLRTLAAPPADAPRAPRQRPAPPAAELPAADPPACAPPACPPAAEALPLTPPPEPQPPPNAPAWLRERRPSIVVPFLAVRKPA